MPSFTSAPYLTIGSEDNISFPAKTVSDLYYENRPGTRQAPTLSPHPTPSTASTRSKRSFSSDDSESSTSSHKRVRTLSFSKFSLYDYRSGQGVEAFLYPPNDLYIDKTRYIIDLPERFQCLVLRPPQFGKTMFLSALYHFYDVHGEQNFSQRFGHLAVTTEPSNPVPHSQHLSLFFDLSGTYVTSSCLHELSDSLTSEVSHTLTSFIEEYATELGVSNAEDYLDLEEDPEANLSKKLVESHGHTLFIGVDNYDAPIRKSIVNMHLHSNPDSVAISEIEGHIDSHFWRPLMAATAIIDKLYITGTLFVNYAALQNVVPNAVPSLHGAFGFTVDEALLFSQSVLPDTSNLTHLHQLCGNYTFSPSEPGHPVPAVINPRLLIDRLIGTSLSYVQDSFELLSELLNLMTEDSGFPAAVTVQGLIEVLATGGIDVGNAGPSCAFDATGAITWSALQFAGALAPDPQSNGIIGTLLIPNSAALLMIHSRVDNVVHDRYNLAFAFSSAWAYFSQGREAPLLEIFCRVFRDLSRKCFGKREPNLKGIVELIFRNTLCSLPGRTVDDVVFPPLESMMSTQVQVPACYTDKILTLKLTTLSLRGMWWGAHPNDKEPTAQALEVFHDELLTRKDDELLDMPYQVWSPTLNAMETRRVGSFFDSELPTNPHFLAVGGAHILLLRRP
ncbi:hypothetical protein R3P38DRAFT_1943444 [Favolaschia claudopus]|uniref:AAA-ATPase-like domain-containing protein n=1 Tax=Favolaschia claudopus TaxID=2862362 RepID=A0AAW0A0Q3_9AGAR